MSDGSLKEVVETIARALVDHPDEVTVSELEGEATVLELRVAPQDLGKVIGKQGRTARAMRTLLRAAGMKSCLRFSSEYCSLQGRR
jgi:predicted RNA-binding protein YlqC (UPF0109 family)